MQQSNRTLIASIVQDQIKIIDSKITAAHNNGFNSIEYDLPINFNINNLSKSDAQTMIYSEIIDVYTKPEAAGGKGFPHTRIDGSETRTVLRISWINGMSEAERSRRQKIIRDHMVQRRT